MKILLKGARIIDPSQGLDGPGDILIDGEAIEKVGEIPDTEDCDIVD